MQSTITIKAKLADDLRRRTVTIDPSGSQLSQLREVISQLFSLPTSGFKMLWRDEDQDLVTLSSDLDVSEALQGSLNAKSVLRIEVHATSQPEETTSEDLTEQEILQQALDQLSDDVPPTCARGRPSPVHPTTAPEPANQSSPAPRAAFNLGALFAGLPSALEAFSGFAGGKVDAASLQAQAQEFSRLIKPHLPNQEQADQMALHADQMAQQAACQLQEHLPELQKQMRTQLAHIAPEMKAHLAQMSEHLPEDMKLHAEQFAQHFCQPDEAEPKQAEGPEEFAQEIAELLQTVQDELPAEAEAEAEHTGIWCDKCNMHPICGVRYTKQLKDDTFDLCAVCFSELTGEEQATLHIVQPKEEAVEEAPVEAPIEEAIDEDGWTEAQEEDEASSDSEAEEAAEDAAACAARVADEEVFAASGQSQTLYPNAPVPQETAFWFLAALRREYLMELAGAVGEFFDQNPDTLSDEELDQLEEAYEQRVRDAADMSCEIDMIAREWAEAAQVAPEFDMSDLTASCMNDIEAAFEELSAEEHNLAEAEAARLITAAGAAEAEAAAKAEAEAEAAAVEEAAAKAEAEAEAAAIPVEWQASAEALTNMGFGHIANQMIMNAEGDFEAALEAALSYIPRVPLPPTIPANSAEMTSLLGELVEMGFEDEVANKKAIAENNFDLKSTVTVLVQAERAMRQQ